MLKIFPHLKDIKIEDAWGGMLAIAMRRLPFFRKLGQTIYCASGYSGHRNRTGVLAGKPICQAIDGDTKGFDLFAKLPSIPLPGGRYSRYPLLFFQCHGTNCAIILAFRTKLLFHII